MRPTVPANLLTVLAYAVGYALVLAAFWFVWERFPGLLYIYRDGEYNLLTSLAYRDWARAFDLTSINPLQGMTSMLVAINPYLNPGQWVFFVQLPANLQALGSYTIYTCEIFFSTFVLARALQLPRIFAFPASLWAALLLIPPFNFLFGFGGWLAGAPMYGHALALSNLSLVAFLGIGARSASSKADLRFVLRNALLTAGLFCLLLAMLLAAPFYYAGMMMGTGLLLGCILLSSKGREQLIWRVAAGLAILAAFVALGIPEFYTGSRGYSARFATAQPILSFQWTKGPGWPSTQQWSDAWNLLCAWGVSCRADANWPFSISANWIHAAIIGGGFAMYATMPKPVSRIGACVAVLWLLLLCLWVAATFISIGLLQLAPSFYYLMMFSMFSILSLYLVYLPVRWMIDRAGVRFGERSEAVAAVAVGIGFALIVVPFMGGPTLSRTPQRATPITEMLRREIALHPGETFRGSVATILGSPDGTLRKALNLGASDKIAVGEFESLLTAAAKSGSTHDLLDLWSWDIPTLSEYGQGISPQLVFYVAKFLSVPGDAIETHFVFPRVANVDVLRAMGVRFMIIDAPVSADGVQERMRLKSGASATLYLYELGEPNLGTFSPLQLAKFEHPESFAARVVADPKVLERTAFVHLPIDAQLTPARDVVMRFERGGVHVSAQSDGRSALLLPVQFSNCYDPVVKTAVYPTVMRANAIHTLVLFERDLDLRLRWRFDFWTGSKCRLQDVNELRALLLR